MRLTLVANPAAGTAERAARDEVVKRLRRLGSLEVVEPASQEVFGSEVRSAARGAEVVVVSGGDGTLNLVVNALRGHDEETALAILPAGTGNDFARTLGMPDDQVEAAASLGDATIRAIDVGLATGDGIDRHFVNGCMGGFPVQVDEALTTEMKRRLGPAAFVAGGLKALPELDAVRIEMNGRSVRDCVAVGVGNGRTCGGGMEVWPEADPGDGLLDACALPAANLAAALHLAVKVRTGKHPDLERVTCLQHREVRIAADPPVEFNVDGEVIGLRTPAAFSIVGQARFLVPAR